MEVDDELYYLSQGGKTVWTSDNTIRFDGGLEVKMKTFRPDRCMLIHYPEVIGMSDSKANDGALFQRNVDSICIPVLLF